MTDSLRKLLESADLNPRQRDAVTAPRGAVAVTAGAGTGKTKVLTTRFAYAVLSEPDTARQIEAVGRLVTITFTEKAATEMKVRVGEIFNAVGRPDLRRELDGAYISTIHSFCMRLLMEHSIEAGLDPDFAILDELSRNLLSREVLKETLGEMNEQVLQDASELSLLQGGTLEGAVLALQEAIRSSGMTPDEIVVPRPSLDSELISEIDRAIRDALPILCETDDPLVGDMTGFLRALHFADPMGALKPAVNLKERINLKGSKNRKEALKRIRDDLLERFVSGLAQFGDASCREALLALVKSFEARFLKAKRARGRLDFSDLETEALALLQKRDAVRDKIRRRFSMVLVDEYQDVNRLQEKIIGELTELCGDTFRVGDVKQSIYGFRHADVNVFSSYMKRVDRDRCVDLAQNYRSRPEIIAPLNRLFASAFMLDDAIEYVPLEPGGGEFPSKDGPSVTLHLAVKPPDSPLSEREIEALSLGRYVRDLLDRKPLIRTQAGPRELRPGDVVVLLRTLNDADVYRKGLEAFRVPAVIDGGKDLFGTPEAHLLACAVRVVANRRDEPALLVLLGSRAVGVSVDGLMLLSARGAEGPGLFGAMREAAAIEGIAREDAAAAMRLARSIDAVARDLPALTLPQLCERLIEDLSIGVWVLTQDAPGRRRENLAIISRGAQSIAEPFGRSPAALAAALKRLADGEGGARQAVFGSIPDAATLMTVHASKGLQFPVVIVADLNKQPGNPSKSFHYLPGSGDHPPTFAALWHPARVGASVKSSDYVEAAQRARLVERRESLRLLYVAATRAMEHLVLSAGVARKADGDVSRKQDWLRFAFDGFGLDFPSLDAGDFTAPGDLEIVVTRESPSPDAGPERSPDDALYARLVSIADRAPAAPLPADRAPDGYSVSQVTAYLACPKRYDLLYRLRLPRELLTRPREDDDGSDRTHTLGAEAYGEIFHSAMERWDGDPAKLSGLVAEVLLAAGFDPSSGASIAAGMKAFADHELGRLAFSGPRTHREISIAWKAAAEPPIENPPLIRGAIDLAVELPDGIVIVDYKTDRAEGFETQRAERYESQILLYAEAAEAYFRRPVKAAWVYFSRSSCAVPVDIGPGKRAALRKKIRELFEADRTGAYAKAQDRCADCDLAGFCAPAES